MQWLTYIFAAVAVLVLLNVLLVFFMALATRASEAAGASED